MGDAKLKVVVTDLGYESYEPERGEIEAIGAELVLAECSNEQEVAEACREADGVITRLAPVGPEAINAMTKCRIIARYGVGVDNVDIPAATAKGIVVANVRDYCDEDVSDQALALMMACVRKISIRDRQVRAGQWDIGSADPIWRVAGKTLGLVGFGVISRTLHRKVSGFNLAEVLVYDPFVSDEVVAKAGARKVELNELMEKSDYISIHAPLTDETRHMIGAAQLALAKKTAIIVNTSRGPLIDPDALFDALTTGKINSAGLDVHEPEPPEANSRWFGVDNVILTDHTGWYSEESQLTLQTSAAKNVALVLSGNKPLFCVNPEVLE